MGAASALWLSMCGALGGPGSLLGPTREAAVETLEQRLPKSDVEAAKWWIAVHDLTAPHPPHQFPLDWNMRPDISGRFFIPSDRSLATRVFSGLAQRFEPTKVTPSCRPLLGMASGLRDRQRTASSGAPRRSDTHFLNDLPSRRPGRKVGIPLSALRRQPDRAVPWSVVRIGMSGVQLRVGTSRYRSRGGPSHYCCPGKRSFWLAGRCPRNSSVPHVQR